MSSISFISADTNLVRNNIKSHTDNLNDTHIKLSTGKNTSLSYKHPTDSSKVTRLQSDIKAYTALNLDLNNKNTMLMVADNGIESQQKKHIAIKELISRSTRDDLTAIQQKELTKEVQVLMQDFNEIAHSSKFNNLQLLNGNLEKVKLNTSIDGYQNIDLNIPSTSTSEILKTRFETGASIINNKQVAIEFEFDNGETIKLPSVVISHSTGTGISRLADIINRNYDSLGIQASYDVSTTSISSLSFGSILDLKINDIDIGSLSMTSKSDYDKLVSLINDKTSLTGVEASLENNKLTLHSPSGRGISLRAGGGIELLKLGENGDSNYGKLTLVNHSGHASNIVNSADVGFNQVASKRIPINYLVQGNLTAEDKQALGMRDKTIFNDAKLTLDNDIFRTHIVNAIEEISNKLINTKKHIAYVQQKITDQKSITANNKVTTNINIDNIDDIDYAKEVLENNKFQKLREGALYTFTKSLAFNNKIQDILFNTLKE